MERSDLLAANALIFKAQGGALDKVAKKSVKVLVVGNPANTNALIASHYAPSIPKKNFTALTRLDLNRATIGGKPLREVVNDNEYLNGPYITKVQKRGAEIIAACGKSSAASAANAACDHVHDWWYGTSGKCTSMGVISDGNHYGAPEGIIYSFPCTIDHSGEWQIINGLKIDEMSRTRMDATGKELVDERKMALGI